MEQTGGSKLQNILWGSHKEIILKQYIKTIFVIKSFDDIWKS